MSISSNKPDVALSEPEAQALASFRRYLSSQGLRLTGQRRLIVQEMFRRRGHFDAEELYEALRSGNRNASRATVYRTLAHLRDCGMVKEVLRSQGRARYEAEFGQAHHDHMICVQCGKVIEFYDERIEELQRRICRRHGFQALEHRMGIRGVCKDCRAAGGTVA